MSRFGNLIHGKTTTSPVVETPVVEEAPVVDTAPASVEEIADSVSEEINFSNMSKEELEEYGRTIGIELDRRHSKKKLIKQLEDHKQYIDSI